MALGDLDYHQRAELITGPDPAAPSNVESFAYDGTALAYRPRGFTASTSA